MWRADWAKGEIKALDATWLYPFAAFVLVLLGLGFLGNLNLPQQVAGRSYSTLLILFLPVMGFILYLKYLLLLYRQRKYGTPACTISNKYGILGGRFSAKCRIPLYLIGKDLHPGHSPTWNWEISCVERRKNGNSRVTRERIIWQAVGEAQGHFVGASLEVAILSEIPYDLAASGTETEDGSHKTKWRLTLRSKSSASKISLWFEIPVFSSAQSDPNFTRAAHDAQILRLRDTKAERDFFRSLIIRSLNQHITRIGVRPNASKKGDRFLVLLGLIFFAVGSGFAGKSLFHWDWLSLLEVPFFLFLACSEHSLYSWAS